MLSVAGFRALHRPGAPLFLPNAWDLASARWLRRAGHPVVGTTSLGVAVAAGLVDGAGTAGDETMRLAERLARAGIPLTVDLESGFGRSPGELAETTARLAELGVVGVNLEDSDAHGRLVDAGLAARRIAAAARSGLFVNARTDPFWIAGAADASPESRLAESLDRARRYLDAGADGVFVPGVASSDAIAALTGALPAPVNVLVGSAGRSTAELAGLGVARISTGSLLFRASLGLLERMAGELAGGDATPPEQTPDYASVAALGAVGAASRDAPR